MVIYYSIIFASIFIQIYLVSSNCIQSEKTALTEFKKSLIDESRCLASWVGNDCCSWEGVTCDDTNGHVITLDLQYLQCKTCNQTVVLRGQISPSLSKLTRLSALYITNEKINGSIPTSIGQLSMLKTLFLNNNTLTGVVSQLHFEKLTQLRDLHMSGNTLVFNVSSTWVPPFQLETINLGSLKLGPRFPSWLRTQSHIMVLRLPNTSISGALPNWFQNVISTIQYLDLSINEIRGKLPEFPENMAEISLGFNKFESLPKCFPMFLYANLVDFSYNLLQGQLPKSCEPQQVGVRRVMDLRLSNNNLSGPIPEYLCLSSPSSIDLSSNQFSGGIPLCLSSSSFLEKFDLSYNNLDGRIPFLSDGLRSLHLKNNFFHGKLPPSLQNLTSLQILDLGGNQITDVVPPWLGKLESLKVLNLQSNGLHGDIPPQLCKLNKLQILSLAENNLSGKIPLCFNNFTAMAVDTREPFQLTGDRRPDTDGYIEARIKGIDRRYTSTLPYLVSLDLSRNNIIGEIPKELLDLVGLLNLNLSSNKLEGKIPEEISKLKNLESLDLSINKLSGPIPISLSNLNYLSHLNLSYNNLTGRIPGGSQLQTLNDPSIYVGNPGLYKEPIFQSCTDDKCKSSDPAPEITNLHKHESYQGWFWAGVGPGLLAGFVGFCGILHFKKSWRYQYFLFIENCYDSLVLAIAVKASALMRKFHKGT